jgi:hypothetical protein
MNKITAEHASAKLMNEELLISAKTFIQHQFSLDTRDNDSYTTEGYLL